MGKVADQLREYADNLANGRVADYEPSVIAQFIYAHAEEIDREHERRMEQCRHETKRAFAKYLRQITAEYVIGHKRKSWLRQMKMQLELEALRVKEAKHEDH